jgi:thiamine biosynthesis lipoprotein
MVGFAETEEAFRETAQVIHDELLVYHQLFDIYNDYDGINNLKTVNDRAGIAPVEVDPAIIALLQDCRAYWELTDGRVNAAMGSVLRLWHDARSDGIRDPINARLPDMAKLEAAAEHTNFDAVVIDEAASTVYITDPACSLDVGAVAKGWATQRAAEHAPEGMLISVGSNVCATGPKQGDNPWVIGIQNPDGSDNLHTIYVKEGSVVTSGDYQRTYYVEGTPYHHIIDPDTRMPASHWRSVSVVCADSGLADALSTALFLLPAEEGKALAAQCGAQALWIAPDGSEVMTPGFQDIIRT